MSSWLSSGAMVMIFVICWLTILVTKGFSPDAVVGLAEFQIAPDEAADDDGVGQVKIRRVIAGLGAARHAHAQSRGELEISGVAQIVGMLVPDDDVLRRHAGSEQSLITAATTAGRVPLNMPGSEKTLMPTTSCVETRLRQAAATLVCAGEGGDAESTIVWTTAAFG